jgi:carboxymethylenebutenolidase
LGAVVDGISSAAVQSSWQLLAGPDDLPLRCWWSRPAGQRPRAAVLVLPEVFGLNAWVRGVADRLAAEGFAALAVPVFARTAPDLELGYDEQGLLEGRRHRDAVTADQLLADLGCVIGWLESQPGLEGRPVGCVGFCFGGHLAMLAATLPQVLATCDFYGARVSTFRPGGGEPTLNLLPQVQGHLLCLAGSADPLMPAAELAAIEAALQAANQSHPGQSFRQLVLPDAGHGFMCEARADFQPQAARLGWAAMLDLFAAVL